MTAPVCALYEPARPGLTGKDGRGREGRERAAYAAADHLCVVSADWRDNYRQEADALTGMGFGWKNVCLIDVSFAGLDAFASLTMDANQFAQS